MSPFEIVVWIFYIFDNSSGIKNNFNKIFEEELLVLFQLTFLLQIFPQIYF